MKRSALLATLGALASLATIFFAGGKSQPQLNPPEISQPQAAKPTPSPQIASIAKPVNTKPSQSHQPLQVPRVLSDDLSREYGNSINLAAFIQHALAHRSTGGTFYAGLAMSECMASIPRFKGAFIDATSADVSLKREVDSAIARTIKNQTRCANVESQYGDMMSLAKIIYTEKKAVDPLQHVSSIAREKPIDSLRAAREFGDANLIGDIIASEGIKILDFLQPGYSLNKPESILKAAAAAVGCDYVSPCWSHEQLAANCALRAECGTKTLDDVARKEYPPEILAMYFEAKALLAPLFTR